MLYFISCEFFFLVLCLLSKRNALSRGRLIQTRSCWSLASAVPGPSGTGEHRRHMYVLPMPQLGDATLSRKCISASTLGMHEVNHSEMSTGVLLHFFHG